MATYYVDTAVGDDGNLGTSEGAGNAWATIQKAIDEVAADDKVWVKATGTYSEALDATSATAGGAATPIVFEGYTSSTGDRGLVTVSGGGSLANGYVPITGTNYYVWKGFRWTDYTSDGVDAGAGDHLCFYNCRFDNNGAIGCQVDDYCMFLNCTADSNVSDGFDINGAGMILFCYAASNGGDGFDYQGGTIMGCVAFSNGANGINISATSGSADNVIIGNTVDGDAKDTTTGINIYTASSVIRVFAINNIVYDCINGIAANADTEKLFSYYNLVNGNTADYVNASTHEGEQTAAPQFKAEASNDYTPVAASPAKNGGMDVTGCPGYPTTAGQQWNIGAILHETTGAGGGATGGLLTGGRM